MSRPFQGGAGSIVKYTRTFLVAIGMTALSILVFLNLYGEGVENTEAVVLFFFWYLVAGLVAALIRYVRNRKVNSATSQDRL